MAKPSYDDQAFIHCPFDGEYRPMFEALVFAVYDCGFVARCALELEDGSQVRIDKIEQIIGDCRLGIHDISRTELDGTWSLPRFNMPLELGLFLGAKRYGTGSQRRKLCRSWTGSPSGIRSIARTSRGRTSRHMAGTRVRR